MRFGAVGFDLWETLVTNSTELSELQKTLRVARIAATLNDHRHAVSPELVAAAHGQVWKRCQELYWSRDLDIPTRTQVEILIENLDLACTSELVERLEALYAEAILDHPPVAVEGAADTLEWVRSKGMRVGLVSNTGRTPGVVLRRMLSSLGLGDLIDTQIFSNEVGACKPSPRIFSELLSGLASDPGRTVFVGDNAEADVAGAQAMGMRAVHFDPPIKGSAFAPPTGRVTSSAPWRRISRLAELPGLLEESER